MSEIAHVLKIAGLVLLASALMVLSFFGFFWREVREADVLRGRRLIITMWVLATFAWAFTICFTLLTSVSRFAVSRPILISLAVGLGVALFRWAQWAVSARRSKNQA